MANEENLKPLGSGALSPEEERAIRSAGGKASQEVLKQKRYAQKVKQEFQELMSLPLRKGDIQKITAWNEKNKKNITVETKICMKLIQDYLKSGNPRLFELIMRYSGGDEEFITDDTEDTPENTLMAALNKQAQEVWKNENTEEKKL